MSFRTLLLAVAVTLSSLASADNTVSVPLTGDGTAYFANISIGTPPQSMLVQLDTGSSDMWVSAPGTLYCKQNGCSGPNGVGSFNVNKSSTAHLLQKNGLETTYGTGGIIKGSYYTDNVVVGGVTLSNFTFAVADVIPGNNIPIMGVGPDSLTRIAVTNGTERPGILDALVTAGAIDRRAFSLYLGDQDNDSGEILFGGVDSSKYEGELTQMPIAKNGTGQYDRYRIDLSTVIFSDSAGNKTISSPDVAIPAILDSGVTTLEVPNGIAAALTSGIGGVYDSAIQQLVAPCAIRENNASVYFQLGGSNGPMYSMPINTLVATSGGVNLTFSDGSAACPLRLIPASEAYEQAVGGGGFVLGDPFMQNVYIVYDLDDWTISVAQAQINAGSGKSGSIVALGPNQGAQADSTATGTPTSLPVTLPSSDLATASSGGGGGGSGSAQPTAIPTVISTVPPSPSFAGLATTATGSAATAAMTSSASSSSSGAASVLESRWSLTVLSVLMASVAGGICML